tara:strand:- start:1909 stop:2445 length:537 start_codon:yes stop_codon:yes gene_type:complete
MMIFNLKDFRSGWQFFDEDIADLREGLTKLSYKWEWSRYVASVAQGVDYVYTGTSHFDDTWKDPHWLNPIYNVINHANEIPYGFTNEWNHCLVNYYKPWQTLGSHQDDEKCLEGSILSISIGGNAEFNYSPNKNAFGTCVTLSDLDCILAKGSWWKENWHSVKNGGDSRINLTFRRII